WAPAWRREGTARSCQAGCRALTFRILGLRSLRRGDTRRETSGLACHSPAGGKARLGGYPGRNGSANACMKLSAEVPNRSSSCRTQAKEWSSSRGVKHTYGRDNSQSRRVKPRSGKEVSALG